MDALLHTLGRMHIIVLHLPIGMLLGVAAWELWRAWRGRRREVLIGQPAVFLAWISVLGSAAAIGTGLAHELELADQADAIWLHKWLGIAAGIMSLFTAILASAAHRSETRAAKAEAPSRTRTTRVYRGVLFLTIAVLLPAGHFGGDLTHGEGFIFEPLVRARAGDQTPEGEQAGTGAGPIDGGDNATILAGAANAREVLATFCASCHGSPRVRGGLRVDSTENMLRGGNTGPAIMPGDPDASLLMQRMLLPLHDDHHMPPSDRPQPSVEDVDAVRNWIRGMGGAASAPALAATGNTGVNGGVTDPGAEPSGQAGTPESGRSSPAFPNPASVSMGLDLSTMSGLDDTRAIAILHSMDGAVTSLSVAGTNVTDTLVVWLESTPRLQSLDLSGTRVTDACVQSLAVMPALTRVTLARTEVSADAIDWLSFARPELEIVTGE